MIWNYDHKVQKSYTLYLFLILSFFIYVTDLTKKLELCLLVTFIFNTNQIWSHPNWCSQNLSSDVENSLYQLLKICQNIFFFSRGFFTSVSASQTHSVLNLFSPLNTGLKFFKTKNVWLSYKFQVFCLIPWTKS